MATKNYQLKMEPLPLDQIEEAVGLPFAEWAHKCHQVSLAIVKSDLLPVSRVARSARGVLGQHSWVVVGNDCYDLDAQIIDPTLWSYDPSVDGIWYGTLHDGRHFPHSGEGTIWQYGAPPDAEDAVVELVGVADLSREARTFLELCGPLDANGWAFLAHAPVRGWPAAEIIGAMYDTDRLRVLIPIDVVGMITDKNPSCLYLKGTA